MNDRDLSELRSGLLQFMSLIDRMAGDLKQEPAIPMTDNLFDANKARLPHILAKLKDRNDRDVAAEAEREAERRRLEAREAEHQKAIEDMRSHVTIAVDLLNPRLEELGWSLSEQSGSTPDGLLSRQFVRLNRESTNTGHKVTIDLKNTDLVVIEGPTGTNDTIRETTPSKAFAIIQSALLDMIEAAADTGRDRAGGDG